MGGGGDRVYIGTFAAGNGNEYGLSITDSADLAYTGFWGVEAPPIPERLALPRRLPRLAAQCRHDDSQRFRAADVYCRSYHDYHDTLNFNVDAWALGVFGSGALVNDNGAAAPTGFMTPSLVITSDIQASSGS